MPFDYDQKVQFKIPIKLDNYKTEHEQFVKLNCLTTRFLSSTTRTQKNKSVEISSTNIEVLICLFELFETI